MMKKTMIALLTLTTATAFAEMVTLRWMIQ